MTLLIQVFKYFWVALAGLIVDYAILALLVEVFSVNYLVAAMVSFVLALLVNYVLSERFVFGDPKVSSGSMRLGLFAIIGVVGLGFLTLLMWVQVSFFGWNYLVAKTLATVIVFAWNFVARKAMYHS